MRKVWPFAFLLLARAAQSAAPVVLDDFESVLRPQWEEKRFKARTEYAVVEEEGNRVLRAVSQDAASGLIYRIAFDPVDYPILTWRWKIERVIETGDATRKSGDDYAARVYVVFPHWFPPKTKVLNYIWANKLPQGDHVPSPFMGGAALIAVQSGPERAGIWVTERRDLVDDYRSVFGQEPPGVGAIAIMTDTDQTGESTIAYYDDLRIEPR